MAVASFVLGIIAIVTSIIPVVGIILATVSLIIAIIANCRKKDREKNRGFKRVAIVLSILAFIVALIMTSLSIISFNQTKNLIDTTKVAILEDSIITLKSTLELERLKLMKNNVDVDKKEAEEIYLKILKYNYADLYNKGYRIKVNEDLTAEIIEPTN